MQSLYHLAAGHRAGRDSLDCKDGGASCVSAQCYNTVTRGRLTLLRKEGEKNSLNILSLDFWSEYVKGFNTCSCSTPLCQGKVLHPQLLAKPFH